ncbi:hypothetical protein [uncultured Anaerovibrio sp.]|uniref:hypothetical protein n=1 Tax=uncultured Anaerovibrio sp. TaxID=361586 RepID=UPI0025E11D11|nr:hypothetical protein [uncultured Anaerovibrio sp.]
MATKQIKRLPVSAETLAAVRKYKMNRMVDEMAIKVEDKFKPLVEEFTARFVNGDWVILDRAGQENSVFYVHGIAGLLPNLAVEDFGRQYGENDYSGGSLDFAGFIGELPSEKIAKYCFISNSKYFKKSCNIRICGRDAGGLNFKRGTEIWFLSTIDNDIHLQGAWSTNYYIAHIPVFLFNRSNRKSLSPAQAIIEWLRYDLTPLDVEFSSEVNRELYKTLHELYKEQEKNIVATDTGISLSRAGITAALDEGEEITLLGEKFSLSDSDEIEVNAEILKTFEEDLLTCDQKRANLSPYGRNLLFGPNEGHWDLWDLPEGAGEVVLKTGYTARDPATDVSASIAAIDFGTKTTVVVCEDENYRQLPLHIGNGEYKSGVCTDNYENPTVLQFIDFESFLNAYNTRPGRPATSWNDVTVSHTAFENLAHTSSDKYYSFLEGLKSWCGARTEKIKIKDASDREWDLPGFMELTSEDPNPIEIYAYYLGLYINNMMRGEIITAYRLSFPVTYEDDLKERIRHSFECGIKKSLPTALLNNEEIMEDFYVELGASEPAAYAISALSSYGFDPKGEEENYYAVFDFGGGTTDFDFGVYKDGPEGQDRYNYSLVHFGANGDRTLGGENLLKLLAFHVFKANAEKLLHHDKNTPDAPVIPFTYATIRENFMGSESLINETSQEARANMKVMMEALRPVWEHPENDEAKRICEEGVTVDLFDTAGSKQTGLRLFTVKPVENSMDDTETDMEESKTVEEDDESYSKGNSSVPKVNSVDEAAPIDYIVDLRTLLRNRIEKGIRNFFYSMAQAFNSNVAQENFIKPLNETGEIAIFLAGNSSKSQIVKDVMDEYIGEQGKAAEILGIDPDKLNFHLYPPLGTPEAITIQREMGISVSDDPLEIMEHPTGKTGVAFGLLRAENIEVIDLLADEESGETFQYYIGRNVKGKFYPIFGREAKIGEWHEFLSDAAGSFTILYSDQAEAATGEAPITIAKKRPVRLKTSYPEAQIYVRPVNAHAIEWAIAMKRKALDTGEIVVGSKAPIELK